MRLARLNLISVLLLSLSLFLITVFSYHESAMLIVATYVVLLFVAIIFAFLVSRSEERRGDVLNLSLTVFCFNVVIVLFVFIALRTTYGLPYLGGGSDDIRYESRAYDALARSGISSYSDFSAVLGAKYSGYYYFLAVIQDLTKTDYHTAIPRLLNSFFLSIASFFVYKVGVSCDISRKNSLRAAYFTGLYPLMGYFSATVVRDTIIVLLILLFAYIVIRLRDASGILKQFGLLVLACVVCMVLWHFRRLSVVAVVGAIVVWLGFDFAARSIDLQTLLLSVIISLVIIVFFGEYLAAWLPDLRGMLTDPEELTARFFERDVGLSAYVWNARPPLSYVLRGVYGLLSPLPIPSFKPLDAYKSLGSLIWLFILPFAFLQMCTAVSITRQRILFIFWLVLFVGTTQTVFTYRHFLQFYPFMFLMAWAGLDRYKRYLPLVIGGDFLTIGSLGAIYIVLRMI